MSGVREHVAQHVLHALTLAVLGEHVLHPAQRLNDAHGRPAGPIETAGRGELEMDLLVAELDRLQTCVDQDFDTCRHSGGEAEIVSGGHAVDDGTRLVAAGDSADDGAIVGYGRAGGQLVLARLIIEASVDAAQATRSDETLQCLVDRGAAAEIGEIAGRPDLIRTGSDSGK